MPKEANFEYFEQALSVPERILVFLDESELTVDGSVDLYGGLVMRSNEYSKVEATLAGILKDYPLAREFHAVEVVNPSKDAEGWTNYSEERRTNALERWGDCLSSVALAIPYLQLNRDQWPQMLERAGAEGQVLKGKLRKPDEAVRVVALHLLLPFVRRDFGGDVVVVVQDAKDRQLQERPFARDKDVFEASLFHAFSHEVAGLQLADLAMYALNRCARLVVQRKTKESRPIRLIDVALLTMFNRLNVAPLALEL